MTTTKRQSYDHETFPQIYERYILSHEICERHRCNLISRSSKFQRFIGEKTQIKDIDADDINRFLIHLETATTLSPSTIKGYRTTILTLLKFAHWKIEEREYVRKIKLKWTPPEGWTLSQIRRLLAVAETLQGEMPHGISKSDFWTCAIHCGYSTGLRWGDLTRLKVAQIKMDGHCSLTQNKTGRPVTVKFSLEALEIIKRHGHELVLPWPFTQKDFCARFAQLVERAEIRGGSFRWLRRTAGSYADAARRGDGRKLLGHSSDQIFDRHYNVDSITNKNPVEPTPLVTKKSKRKAEKKAPKKKKRKQADVQPKEVTFADWL